MIPVASPSSIETAYVEQYRAGFEQAFQQFDARFAPYVEMERQASEFDYYDRIGIAEDMTEDTTRYGDNPKSEIPHDRRRIGLRDYELGKYVDEKDLIRTLTDPSSAYQVAMRASGFRKLDDIVMDAFFGPAYIGKKGENVMNFVSAPASGKVRVGGYSKGHSNPITTAGRYVLGGADEEGISVAHDYVDGTPASSGITIDKLKAIKFTMMRLESATQDTVLNCFLGSRQFEQLLGIEEIINADYSVRRSLEEGKVTTFMGYRFIHTERLPVDASGHRRCIVSASPKFLKLAVAKNLQLDAWRDPSKKNIPYIYFKLCTEASRMWGEISAEMKCAE